MNWVCKCGSTAGLKRQTSLIIDCLSCGREETMEGWYRRYSVRMIDLNISGWALSHKYPAGQLFNHKGDAIRWMGSNPWEGGSLFERSL